MVPSTTICVHTPIDMENILVESTPDPSGYWKLSEPDWNAWSNVNRAQLWQASALACDVDPANFMHGIAFGQDAMTTYTPSSLKELAGLVRSAVGSGTLTLVEVNQTNLMSSFVEAEEFASWLRLIKYKTPEGFPWSARALQPANHQWPWGSYQNNALGLLALAADKFWKNYRAEDASTAPTNRQVIDWLLKKGTTSNKAEQIASILRPDDLRTGPR